MKTFGAEQLDPAQNGVESWRAIAVQDAKRLEFFKDLSLGLSREDAAIIAVRPDQGDIEYSREASEPSVIAEELATAAQNSLLAAHRHVPGSCPETFFSSALLELPVVSIQSSRSLWRVRREPWLV